MENGFTEGATYLMFGCSQPDQHPDAIIDLLIAEVPHAVASTNPRAQFMSEAFERQAIFPLHHGDNGAIEHGSDRMRPRDDWASCRWHWRRLICCFAIHQRGGRCDSRDRIHTILAKRLNSETGR